jgi:hypothetical protein
LQELTIANGKRDGGVGKIMENYEDKNKIGTSMGSQRR